MNDAVSNLLDATLDDLADMPEFKPFPNGAHRATIEFLEKEINKKHAVEVKFTGIETLELANPNDVTDPNNKPIVKGSTASVLCQLDNEMGQGSLKDILKPIYQHFGHDNKVSMRQVMNEAKGLEVVIATKQRSDAKDETKKYMSIVTLMVA